MAAHRCSHTRQATGILQCELLRPSGLHATLYSAQFEVSICADCGFSQFYCKSYQDVCAWLSAHIGTTHAMKLASTQTAGRKDPERR
jgi:hypothetical protein